MKFRKWLQQNNESAVNAELGNIPEKILNSAMNFPVTEFHASCNHK